MRVLRVVFAFLVILAFSAGCATKRIQKEHSADLNDIKEFLNALSQDDDGDGVSNLNDKDNSTPSGVIVGADGMALDTDADGVPDYLDADPFTARGAVVDDLGRSIDSDGDGVSDDMDVEPNTPKGAMVNFQGMAVNAARSGVEDGTIKILREVHYRDTSASQERRIVNTGLFHVGVFCPSKMRVEESYEVRIQIGDIASKITDKVREEIRKAYNETMRAKNLTEIDKEGFRLEEVNLSEYVAVSLKASNLKKVDILLEGENPIKKLLKGDLVEWFFHVNPKDSAIAGSKAKFTLYIHPVNNGVIGQDPLYRERFSVEIQPKIGYFKSLWNFMTRNPEWPITTLILPIVGFFAGIWKERRKPK